MLNIQLHAYTDEYSKQHIWKDYRTIKWYKISVFQNSEILNLY